MTFSEIQIHPTTLQIFNCSNILSFSVNIVGQFNLTGLNQDFMRIIYRD